MNGCGQGRRHQAAGRQQAAQRQRRQGGRRPSHHYRLNDRTLKRNALICVAGAAAGGFEQVVPAAPSLVGLTAHRVSSYVQVRIKSPAAPPGLAKPQLHSAAARSGRACNQRSAGSLHCACPGWLTKPQALPPPAPPSPPPASASRPSRR